MIYITDDPHSADGGQDDPLGPPVNQIGEFLQSSTNDETSRVLASWVTCSEVRLVAGVVVAPSCSLSKEGCLSLEFLLLIHVSNL